MGDKKVCSGWDIATEDLSAYCKVKVVFRPDDVNSNGVAGDGTLWEEGESYKYNYKFTPLNK